MVVQPQAEGVRGIGHRACPAAHAFRLRLNETAADGPDRMNPFTTGPRSPGPLNWLDARSPGE